jgi:CheY-like chemotaxis protein
MTPTGKKADLLQRNGKGVDATLVKPVRQHSLLGALTRAVAAKPQDPLFPILRPSRAQGTPAITPDLRTAADPIECAIGPVMPRVLVAEDNIVNQKFIQILLKKMGFRCDVVANGLEALAALDQIPYDLVLMDCQMPELDGFEATRRIRSRTDRVRFIPIIALTANVMPGAADACLAAGMNEYMSKPVRLEELLSKLHFHLAAQPDSGHGAGTLERRSEHFQEATAIRSVAA